MLGDDAVVGVSGVVPSKIWSLERSGAGAPGMVVVARERDGGVGGGRSSLRQ